jgi:hypothetical protein
MIYLTPEMHVFYGAQAGGIISAMDMLPLFKTTFSGLGIALESGIETL